MEEFWAQLKDNFLKKLDWQWVIGRDVWDVWEDHEHHGGNSSWQADSVW